MYLIDTNVINEARKRQRAHPGVRAFFQGVVERDEAVYLSVVTVGELRRGVELIRHRGDAPQAALLERWLSGVLDEFGQNVLGFDGMPLSSGAACASPTLPTNSTSRSPPSR